MINKAASIVTSVFLLVVIVAGFFVLKPYNYVSQYVEEVRDSFVGEKETEVEKDVDTGEKKKKDLQQDMISNVDPDITDLSSKVIKGLNLKDIYLNSAGTVLKNGYVVRMYPYADCHYEISQMKWLKEFTSEKGIDLLYYNKPTKYLQDSYVTDETGIPTYVNENADRFLKELDQLGIEHADFRDLVKGKNAFSYFYRTDHHETVPTGLMMAGQLADTLNERFGYDIDMDMFDPANYESKEYKQSWLGEQGKKLGKALTGLDDYTELWPKFSTSFTMTGENIGISGSFRKVMIDEDCYDPKRNTNMYKTKSWHYSYRGNRGLIVNNKNKNGRKVLVLGDSYDAVINTFLSLGFSEVQGIIMRRFDGDLEEYISDNDFDIVIVSYASQMIGAYDQKNDNKKMFAFNPGI